MLMGSEASGFFSSEEAMCGHFERFFPPRRRPAVKSPARLQDLYGCDEEVQGSSI